jgi:hypothetical protein
MGDVFRLEALLLDKPGALERLISSLASLNLNIVWLESATISDSRFHFVELLADWSNAKDAHPANQRARRGAIYDYASAAHRIPLDQRRYQILYETVMADCIDLVVADRSLGRPVPYIKIDPFSYRREENRGITKVEAAKDVVDKMGLHAKEQVALSDKYSAFVALRLPRSLVKLVCNFTATSIDDIGKPATRDIRYLLQADYSSKTLRALLFPKGAQLFHFALEHDNRPGSLAACSELVAESRYQFNVLSSIVRPISEGRSIWELIAELRSEPECGSDGPGSPSHADDIAKALSKRQRHKDAKLLMRPAANSVARASGALCRLLGEGMPVELKERLVESGFSVVLRDPFYPSFGKKVKPRDFRATETDGHEQNAQSTCAGTADRTLEAIRLENLERFASEGNRTGSDRKRAIADVARRIHARTEEDKPSVFFSFSGAGRELADAVRTEHVFAKHMQIVELQDAPIVGQNLTPEAIRRISHADFFLSIWQHEYDEPGGNPRVSPWLPFEYGAALAAGKTDLEAIVVHSSVLPDKVTTRINTGISQPRYDELTFTSKTVPIIVRHVYRYWLEEYDGPCEGCVVPP